MSKFKYRSYTAETVAARANQKGGDYDSYIADSAKVIKMKEGENNFRILPATWDEKWGAGWSIQLWVHERIGTDKGHYICLDKMLNERCPICEAMNDLDEEDRKSVKARKKVICYVIDRDNEKEGPQVWVLGWKLEKALSARSRDKKTNKVLFIDRPDDGYDISFVREGTGLNTQYVQEDIARSPSPIHDDEVKQEKWLAYITKHPLDSVLVFEDADYIEQVFMGRQSADNAEDEPEPEKPARGHRRPAADEGDEDTPPPSRAPRRSTRAVEEDEPEAEDEDELPDDEQMADNSRSGRARGGKPAPRHRSDPEPEDEPEEDAGEDEPEDEPEDRPRPGRVRDDVRRSDPKIRRAVREAVEEDEPEPEEETPTTRARRTLTSMKPGAKTAPRRR